MTNPNDQFQHGYYYAPLENGKYANEGRELGSTLLKMAVSAVSSYKDGAATSGTISALNNLGDDPIGAIGGAVGEGAGWYIDNASSIGQNLNTMIQELNDPSSWHPDLGM
ncbi:hypothetical protein [Bradyrhizobium sp. I1.7.5]|uniref:hypothetical protein n=1 Tax=Bradyrhizobium sp. I1.7.5 TaxID=3156363 RepID=UPI003391E384